MHGGATAKCVGFIDGCWILRRAPMFGLRWMIARQPFRCKIVRSLSLNIRLSVSESAFNLSMRIVLLAKCIDCQISQIFLAKSATSSIVQTALQDLSKNEASVSMQFRNQSPKYSALFNYSKGSRWLRPKVREDTLSRSMIQCHYFCVPSCFRIPFLSAFKPLLPVCLSMLAAGCRKETRSPPFSPRFL